MLTTSKKLGLGSVQNEDSWNCTALAVFNGGVLTAVETVCWWYAVRSELVYTLKEVEVPTDDIAHRDSSSRSGHWSEAFNASISESNL